ncbi:MAG: hypothetical protein ACOYL6_15250 [Bacteriovoracaceae bacterium]
MKKILISFLVLASMGAIAHPLDTDPGTAIDVGSILKVEKDVNIPSFNKILLKDGVEYRFYSEVASGPFCRLSATDREDREFTRDVLLKSGASLRVISNSSTNNRVLYLIAVTGQGNKIHFDCYHSLKGAKGTQVPSIKEVKDSLGDVFSLELAEPIEI